ncbi:hypothetical protein I8751_22340 [Nostocaceae cyanobacterium CENA357]|uniref:Uncharacterized protein n=1 Tax=Atlanticothrix silvestris CENA357 TaxID=1725252 RepID=A0A8J7L3J3_9CYAN|nr:hypothetical protein [Atlanticothrix silvestris]MBH8555035.1 hypothetical protein [Atlanticothrix silvestris CENA357]
MSSIFKSLLRRETNATYYKSAALPSSRHSRRHLLQRGATAVLGFPQVEQVAWEPPFRFGGSQSTGTAKTATPSPQRSVFPTECLGNPPKAVAPPDNFSLCLCGSLRQATSVSTLFRK